MAKSRLTQVEGDLSEEGRKRRRRILQRYPKLDPEVVIPRKFKTAEENAAEAARPRSLPLQQFVPREVKPAAGAPDPATEYRQDSLQGTTINHDEAIGREGIKAERPPYGRPFIANINGKTFFVALGNRLLCGDLGFRTELQWKLDRKQSDDLYAWGHIEVPAEFATHILMTENYLGPTTALRRFLFPTVLLVSHSWTPRIHHVGRPCMYQKRMASSRSGTSDMPADQSNSLWLH